MRCWRDRPDQLLPTRYLVQTPYYEAGKCGWTSHPHRLHIVSGRPLITFNLTHQRSLSVRAAFPRTPRNNHPHLIREKPEPAPTLLTILVQVAKQPVHERLQEANREDLGAKSGNQEHAKPVECFAGNGQSGSLIGSRLIDCNSPSNYRWAASDTQR